MKLNIYVQYAYRFELKKKKVQLRDPFILQECFFGLVMYFMYIHVITASRQSMSHTLLFVLIAINKVIKIRAISQFIPTTRFHFIVIIHRLSSSQVLYMSRLYFRRWLDLHFDFSKTVIVSFPCEPIDSFGKKMVNSIVVQSIQVGFVTSSVPDKSLRISLKFCLISVHYSNVSQQFNLANSKDILQEPNLDYFNSTRASIKGWNWTKQMDWKFCDGNASSMQSLMSSILSLVFEMLNGVSWSSKLIGFLQVGFICVCIYMFTQYVASQRPREKRNIYSQRKKQLESSYLYKKNDWETSPSLACLQLDNSFWGTGNTVEEQLWFLRDKQIWPGVF